jgi:hypothetical protein
MFWGRFGHGLALEATPLGARRGLEAVAAVNGAIAAGLEWQTGDVAAGGADSFKELAIRTLRTIAFAGATAIGAALRWGGETARRMELLLAGGKDEFRAAIDARHGLVFVHA